MSVRGQELDPGPSAETRLIVGDGTRVSDDGTKLLAAVDGHAVVIGQRVTVSSVYRVPGDVSVATGHVNFVGSVVIAGDVRPGFRVHAAGDVEVQGSVDGGIIECGGNVSVRYGITRHAHVTAAGNIKAKFAENAELHSGGHVWITDGIVRSRVESDARVQVLGRYGMIVGGEVVARLGVSAREIGSAAGIATSIEVGNAPEMDKVVQEARTELTRVERELEAQRTRLRFLIEQSSAHTLTPSAARAVKSTWASIQGLLTEYSQLTTRCRSLADKHAAIQLAGVEAHEQCHADVRVRVGSGQCAVTSPRRRVRFCRSEQAHEVRIVSLSTSRLT